MFWYFFIASSLCLGFEEFKTIIIFNNWIFWILILQRWPKTSVSCYARAGRYLCWYYNIFKIPSLLFLAFFLFLSHVWRVVETLKDYAIKALVNRVDHLGYVTYKVNDLLEEEVVKVFVVELRVLVLNRYT